MAPMSTPSSERVEVFGRLHSLGLQARAERLAILAGTMAGEGRAGSHGSRLHGDGTEFADYKSYTPGDDPRQLDWRVLARSDRLVVRRFETERVVRAELLIDVSRSMEYGSMAEEPDADLDWPVTKSEVAAMACAILGSLLLRQGDSVAVSLVGDEVTAYARRSGEAQLPALCLDVARCIPSDAPKASLAEAVTGAAARLRGPGMLVVCTDALDEDRRWLDRLAEARLRGVGSIVLHVEDRRERNLSFDEPGRFVEPETGQVIQANPNRVRSVYRRVYLEHVEQLRRQLHSAGIEHVVLETGVGVRSALGAYLASRPRSGSTRDAEIRRGSDR